MERKRSTGSEEYDEEKETRRQRKKGDYEIKKYRRREQEEEEAGGVQKTKDKVIMKCKRMALAEEEREGRG